MHRLVPALIALIHVLSGDVPGAPAGTRERTFLRALERFDAAKILPEWEAIVARVQPLRS